MIDELEILGRYLDEAPTSSFDLQAATDRFVDVIRAESEEVYNTTGRKGRRRHRLAKPLASVIGTAAASLLLVLLLIPGISHQQPIAAAAELRQIASVAGGQSVPALGTGQYLATTERISLLGSVSTVGSTSTPGAQATIIGTFSFYEDSYGSSCISATSEPAEFATPANRAAWQAAGMVDSPANQPITTCSMASQSPFQTAPIEEGGIIDVSRLPTDPAVLANQLATGTTPVPSVNTLYPHPGESAGFERAVYLLVSPKIGDTPQFTSALYSALSLIPGIKLVGQETSHLGVAGIAFTGTKGSSGPTIIVDPSNGVLLEARDISSPSAFIGLGQSYLAPSPTPSIATEGGVGGTSIQWLDPIGSPAVVTSLPDGLSIAAPTAIPDAIEGIIDSSVGYAQIQPLNITMATRFGMPISEGYGANANGRGGSIEYDLHSAVQLRGYEEILRSSGLFTSLRSYEAPGQN